MLGNFIYSKSKNLFLQELEAGNVLDEAVVFIEDTKEIWNHGIYFDGKNTVKEFKQYVDDKIDNLNKVTQTVDLVSGLNWFSSYVKITTEDLLSALGDKVFYVQGYAWTADYMNNKWVYEPHTFDYSKMYMIETSEACTIELSGELLNPDDILITLKPGWNNIGYPVNVETRISDAFSRFTPHNGDIIKDNLNNVAEYMDGQWLDGGINMTMEPTKGYQYYNASSETKTFTFPTELDIALSTKQDKLVSSTNIKTVNGQSLLGEGDIIISSESNSSRGAYALVEHDVNDTTYTLTPNTFHIWDEISELSLTLADPTDTTIANEYLFQFTSGSTATTLTLPDNIKWLETPSIESDKVY